MICDFTTIKRNINKQLYIAISIYELYDIIIIVLSVNIVICYKVLLTSMLTQTQVLIFKKSELISFGSMLIDVIKLISSYIYIYIAFSFYLNNDIEIYK